MTEKSPEPQERMFIGQAVPSVDRGVTSHDQLFMARRPDSPYLVPDVDIEYVRASEADEWKRHRDIAEEALQRIVNTPREGGTLSGVQEWARNALAAIAECEGEAQAE